MDFGKLPNAAIPFIDFTLPKPSAFSDKVLAGKSSTTSPKVYVGCTSWSRKEWVGMLYPKGTKDVEFLSLYARHFNTVEFNATHYKIYDTATILKWAEKVNKSNFVFSPKLPQSISHAGNLISPDAMQDSADFFTGIRLLGEHLGPVFIQVSDGFSPSARRNLYTYLKSLPTDIQFFLELRNPEWFADSMVRQEWMQVLNQLNIGAVITDTAGRRDCVHMELTVPKTFIRFVGNNLHPSDYKRIDAWVKQIEDWMGRGLKELYFFMHQPDEISSLQLIKYAIEQLNLHCNAQLKPLEFIEDAQTSLF